MEKLSRRGVLRLTILTGGALAAASLVIACGGGTASPAVNSTPAPQTAPTQPLPAVRIVSSTPTTAASTAVPTQAAATSVAAPTQAAISTFVPPEPGVPGPDIIIKPPQAKQPITLRFHMRTGGEKSEPSIYVYRPGEWTQQTGIKVQLEPIPGDANYVPKLETLAAAGTIGDLTWSSDGHNEYRHLAQAKVLQPVDDFLTSYKISRDEWIKAVLDTLTMDGKTWALPKAGYPGYSWVWVNLKMFKDAGIPEPPVYGNTFDDLRTWANKLSQGPKDKRDVYGLSLKMRDNQPITSQVRQFGGDLISKDGTTSTVGSQGFADWLNWAYQLIVQDKV
ncbi:MAG TPA: extracellular solute-binding protein, partial [Chloroflexota bacterium]|nr:extracellular solute-binding protein [Chloroflexota bacterium]